MKEQLVCQMEAGQSVTAVSRAMGALKSVISGLKKHAEGANAMQRHASGRKMITTPEKYRYVSLLAEWNRNATPSLIAADLAIATTTRFCQNRFTLIKLSLFLFTEACSMHFPSTTLSS